ncbi:MAG: DNA polymerase III subunit gamma/tau [Mogibacterium sp.]|nr:DNA polymerase III subunit gamma/tau [Mogibacterium sp.]
MQNGDRMQLSLYRAERPEVFEDIIGQKHIVRILQNQIRTGTVSQAYLFSGTHGTGKTSTARILAKAVNCLEGIPGSEGSEGLPCGHCANCEAIREGRFVDCIELDAASNNGVDDLRAIIDMVKYPPSVGRYKVYIIDEVHMLSQAAENAFLKTLEEPPEHAIFILATTDPQKVRSTIRSRCMQLNFKRVSEDELVSGMERICAKRGVDATRDALVTIASRADGSVRDALSILEQCMAAGDTHLDRSLVLEYTGAAGEDFYLALTDAVRTGDISKVFIYIDEIIKRGKDAKQILKDWLTHYRNLMVVKYVARPERMIGSSPENTARLKRQADALEMAQIERAIRLISEYINIGRYSERPRILLETAAVRLAGGGSAGSEEITGTASLREARSSARQAARPARAAQQPQTESTREPAQAAPEPQDDEPIEMITAAPREQIGEPDEMWGKIVDAVARTDRSFVSLIGRHSRGTEFESGELIVTIKPGKMRLANDKLGDITRTAKGLYGNEFFVTLRSGDPDEEAGKPRPASEQETARIIDDDINVSDIASDVENLFGIKPEITG